MLLLRPQFLAKGPQDRAIPLAVDYSDLAGAFPAVVLGDYLGDTG